MSALRLKWALPALLAAAACNCEGPEPEPPPAVDAGFVDAAVGPDATVADAGSADAGLTDVDLGDGAVDSGVDGGALDEIPPTIGIATPAANDCVGPNRTIGVTFADDASGIDTASFAASVAGVDVTAAFVVDATSAVASVAMLSTAVADGSVTVTATISDVAGNSASTALVFSLDRTGPNLTLEPANDVPVGVPVQLVARYADDGCAQIDMTSFSATFDGANATSDFTIASTEATNTVGPLTMGQHDLSAMISDTLGNRSSAMISFFANSPATGLEVSIAPAPANAVPVGATQMLTVRAVTAMGRTATDFAGQVLLLASDGTASIDSVVLDFDMTHLGERIIPVTFFDAGIIVVSAEALAMPPMDFYASLVVQAMLDNPVIVPAPPAVATADGEVLVEGRSFPGGTVEIVVDGQVVATTVAGMDGWFGVALSLDEGTHAIFARATHPVAMDVRTSLTFMVTVPAASAVGLRIEPAALTIALGQSVRLEVVLQLATGDEVTVTSSAAYAVMGSAVSVSNDGVVTASTVGSDTVTASFAGQTAQVAITVAPPTLESSSPVHGEEGVAVTRETILRFSAPLDPGTVSAQSIRAEFGGQVLQSRLHVSPDQKRVTLFYAAPLPASARVRVTVDGDALMALGAGSIDADGDGQPGGVTQIDFDTLSLTVVPGTSVVGRVFASEIMNVGGGSVNVPLEGVHITVDGAETVLFADTDAMGNFRLEPAPAGRFFVHIDGRTASATVTGTAYYPFVGKPWDAVAGEETNVGNVFLPLVQDGSLQSVSDTQDVTITFPASVLARYAELQGVQITVPAGSLFDDRCAGGGQVGLAPVDPDRLPGVLPDGLELPLVITVQTNCATNFDTPAGVCFPNLNGLPPGADAALWGFNHDSGQWEIQAPMTVTQDGLLVCTEPGTGVRAPGWFGVQSGTSANGGGSNRGDRSRRRPGAGNQECSRNDCPCDGHCQTANAVYLHSGEERIDRTDLRITGRGDLHFEMRRRYRSQLDYDGPLGQSWDFDYNDQLFREPNGDIMRANGRSHLDMWLRNIDGTYAAPAGHFRTMVQEPDGRIVMRSPNGMKRIYGPDGRLQAYQDRHGNVMLFHYDGFGNLDTVVDPYGREVDFQFERQTDGQFRLARIIDFFGREVVYRYDVNGDLVEVRTPVVVGTSIGNDFPNGRVERYTYSSGFTDPRLNHNMLTLTRPEEVARRGPPSLVWTYGTNASDPLTFDKVLTETEGGTNASMVAAGGTMSLMYERLNATEPGGQPTLPRGKVTITERNGNQKEYFTNERNHHIMTRRLTRGLRANEPAFYESRTTYDPEGLKMSEIRPEGDEVRYSYASGLRGEQQNVTEMRHVAGPRGGGEDIVVRYTYEPLYNQIASITSPRGNAANFTPPIGSASAARYTQRFFYDYQESSDAVPEATKWGIDLSGVARGLGDLNADGRIDQSAGNVVRMSRPSVTLVAGSNQAQRLGDTSQEILTEVAWNDRGQMLYEIDGEGNVHALTYFGNQDPDGNGDPTFSPFIELVSEATGYMASMTTDARTSSRRTSTAPPAQLTQSFTYDPIGNVKTHTNERGVRTEIEYNALHEPVAFTRGADISAAVSSGQLITAEAPLRYQTRLHYDANGRVVRTQVENRDTTTTGVGRWIDSAFTYDILGKMVSASREVDASTSLLTQFRYDANELLVSIEWPEGTKKRTEYDERNLPFRVTRGADTAEASTRQFDYDRNGNMIRTHDAEDNDGDGEPEAWTVAYDGFNRPTRTTDPFGNVQLTTFDIASNAIRKQVMGHPAGQPAATPVALSEVSFSYDELDRVFQVDHALFLANGFNPTRTPDLRDADGDGVVRYRYEYDALSRMTHSLDDDGQLTTSAYDGAHRVIDGRDAVGNRSQLVYDKRSNVIRRVETEVATADRVSAEVFTTHFVFDQLDRVVRVTDNAGQTVRYAYDSRDNRVRMTDAEGASVSDPLGLFGGPINGPGNSTTWFYDGINRRTKSVMDLRVGGTGGGALDTSNPMNPDGQVRTRFDWDGNSRLVASTDDNNNRTTFTYDALNRMTTRVLPDATQYTFTYDRDDNMVMIVDPNGTQVTEVHDALNRRVSRSVVRGPGVAGTTMQAFEYDGLSRLTRATDDNGNAANTTVVERVYDSLNQVIEARQDGRVVSSVYEGDGRRASLTYPGGRALTYAYDTIDRVTAINDGTTNIVQSQWIGPTFRPLEHTLGNSVVESWLNSAGNAASGYDAVRRVVAHRSRVGANAFVDRTYDYNRAGLRTMERRVDDSNLTDHYSYDSAYRLADVRFDEDGGMASRRDKTMSAYVLDGANNRRDVMSMVTSVGVVQQSYDVNALNQYVSIGGVANTHDGNGNLVADPTRSFTYDFRDRLVAVDDTASGNRIAEYRYDAVDRRVKKIVFDTNNPGTALSETDYLYDGWRNIEEQGAMGTEATYVYGIGIDDVVQMQRTKVGGGFGTYYLHHNARRDVVAVSDAMGTVVEKFRYDDFGSPESASTVANPYMFQGRRYDEESGLYYYRRRNYDPTTGRFIQRDPAVDETNAGNLYAFVGNSPVSMFDPMGLSTESDVANVATQGGNALSLLAEEAKIAAARARGHADWLQNVSGSGYSTSPSGRVTPNPGAAASTSRLTVQQGRALAQEMQAIRAAEQQAANAARNARVMGGVSNGLAVAGGAYSGYNEYHNGNYDSTAGQVTGATAVGVGQTLVGLDPYASGAAAASGLVDDLHRLGQAYEVFGDGPPPKIMEVYNNAWRLLGVGADVINAAVSDETDCRGRPKHDGWRSVERFVNHAKHEQGSVSRGLVDAGEWLGDNIADLGLWIGGQIGTGQGGRAARLEQERQQLLRRLGR